ncbi:MAG TPA: Uma2 family endonuclease, partial [Methylomirabilota bacterium]|nr:Uma2 family endonuclease [Methylomirabilota bacterium]
MAIGVRARRFSVEEYHQMVRTGILKEDDRVELIEGEITEMTPIGPRHAVCVAGLTEHLVRSLAGRAVVWSQSPIRLGPHSEPQPDVTLVQPPRTRYADAHPRPEHILLIIEVGDTTVEDDRMRKIPLYARAGILETWLVNLPGEAIEVYRDPAQDGYRDARTVRRGLPLAPLAFPDVTLTADEIL